MLSSETKTIMVYDFDDKIDKIPAFTLSHNFHLFADCHWHKLQTQLTVFTLLTPILLNASMAINPFHLPFIDQVAILLHLYSLLETILHML